MSVINSSINKLKQLSRYVTIKVSNENLNLKYPTEMFQPWKS